MGRPADDRVWYVAYGSNLSAARFACYLTSGTPRRGRRANPGARDPSPPARTERVELPGTVYFAGRSAMWGGAVAAYDHTVPGRTLGRAYLIGTEQMDDVVAQEMGRPPGGASPTIAGMGEGGHRTLGPGRYETLVGCGVRAGAAMVTLTAPWALADVQPAAPSLAYLATMAAGLVEAHGLDTPAAARYLARLPGARGHWSADGLDAWLDSAPS